MSPPKRRVAVCEECGRSINEDEQVTATGGAMYHARCLPLGESRKASERDRKDPEKDRDPKSPQP